MSVCPMGILGIWVSSMGIWVGSMGIRVGSMVGSIRIGSVVGYNWGNGGNWEGLNGFGSKGNVFTSCGSVKSGLESGLSLGNFGKVSQVSAGSLDTSIGDDSAAVGDHESSMFTGNSSIKSLLEFGLCGGNLGSVFNGTGGGQSQKSSKNESLHDECLVEFQ